MGDDYVLFMVRGVLVLYLIFMLFLRVWYMMEDDGEYLDIEMLRDWVMLVMGFVLEWMDVGKGKL